MTSREIVHDKIHFRHDPKWSRSLETAESGGVLVCVACVLEMIESEDMAVRATEDCSPPTRPLPVTCLYRFYLTSLSMCVCVVQSVRKSFALSGITEVLKCSPGAMRELLQQDHRVLMRFTASLMGEHQLENKRCLQEHSKHRFSIGSLMCQWLVFRSPWNSTSFLEPCFSERSEIDR